nr:twin-arginine translocase TatA/TatE family subunit [uncultured Flavobacterium sp.]
MGGLSPMEVIVVIAVILLLFGGKKIPELMKGLGSGIKEFKNATKEENIKNTSNKSEDTNKKSE